MNRFKHISRWLYGLFFIAVGANHFLHTPFYVSIMPPYLPWPVALVYVSGVAEIGLGGLLLFERWSRLAASGIDRLVDRGLSGECAYGVAH